MATRVSGGSARRGDVYLGSPAYADVLVAELARLGAKHPVDVAPGVIVVDAGPLLDPCFALDVLPDAVLVTAKSANDLAGALLDAVGDMPERVHVVLPEVARRGSRALEEHPLAAARVDLADVVDKKRAGRVEKHGVPAVPGLVVTAVLVDAWSAWVSAAVSANADPVPALLAWPSRFPGGRALGEDAKDAPSSAHRKLDEALLWLEREPGPDDMVLDLGAAPGGWSWVALQKGARVWAVDRADLSPDVARHERLTHVKADAFTWTPERMPTWLLCDVIAEPERSLDVAKRALTSRSLKGLVVTLKLKQPVSLKLLDEARAVAQRTQGFFGRCKHLAANKLEVTLMMRRA